MYLEGSLPCSQEPDTGFYSKPDEPNPLYYILSQNKQLLGLNRRGKLYQRNDRCLSPKLVPNFADKECRVINTLIPYSRILGFLDRSRYFLFQVAPQLYSRGWVDTIPDPLLLINSGNAGNRSHRSILQAYHKLLLKFLALSFNLHTTED
jgi:hypothetical protein